MPIRSIDDIRRSWGQEWADASDAELVNAYSRAAKLNPTQVAIQLGFDPGRGGLAAKRLSSAVDRYQAGLYDVGEQAAGALGLNRVSDWMRRRREENALQADVAAARAQMMGGIESYKDVGGIGDAANYVGGLAIQSLPYMAEAVAGGLGARALMGGTRAALGAARETGDVAAATAASRRLAAGQTAGAVGAGYPSAVGDVLSSQREQAGVVDPGSAALLGAPYAALNVFGLEGALARGQLYRSGLRRLDAMQGVTGGLTRAGVTGARLGLVEGATEVGQEGLNQLGRMQVDPNEAFLSPQAVDRFGESFVGGAALGGTLGAAGGGWRRTTPQNLLPGANPQRDEPLPPTEPVQDPTAVQARIDQMLGINRPSVESDYAAQVAAAANMPSGVFVSDPTTGLERELSVGDLYELRARGAGGEGLPRLGQTATPGVTGSLFGEVAGPVRPQPPEAPETYEDLLSAARSVEAYLSEARATGNRALEDAALSALNQIYARVNTLQPGQPGQMPLWSGVYETVGGRPIELTGTEAARGGLPTLDGEREFAPQQDRRQQEIIYAIRSTNQSLPRGERMTPAQVGRFINQYLALLDRPADLQEFLQTASIPDPVLTVALDIAEGRQRQMVDFGTGFAQPGVRVGQAPVSTGTEQQMRERNQQQAAEERQAAEAETARLRQESELESANARVAGQRVRETEAKRRRMLDEALEGAANPKNARNRFVRRLRKEGMAGGITPAESQAIERYFDVVAATAPPPQPPTEIPSTPNEMPADLVPEKAEREAPPAARTTRRDRPGFNLSPPPQTQADLGNLARAQARRDRRAAGKEPTPEETPQEGPAPRQGALLAPKTGKPTAEATMVTIEVTDADGNPVEVDVAASKVRDYKKEIDKFRALIDCLKAPR